MGEVKQDVLDEIIRRIVEVARPGKIIMFGSAARGEMGPHSDVDLLVIRSGVEHRGRLTGDIYMNLIGAGQAVDIIVVTPEDIERYGESVGLVYRSALGEAKVVYATRTKRSEPGALPSRRSQGMGEPCPEQPSKGEDSV